MRKLSLLIIAILQIVSIAAFAQQPGTTNAIYSGIPWFDNNGNPVSAHAGNIVKDKGKFYLFGEAHTDTSNAFAGFNCYSSVDLYNWKFEKVALPVQASGKLGPNRVGERAKVMKNHKTGEFIMYMHVDTLGYKDQFIGYATSTNITGPYTFHGPLLFNNKPIKKWDMGVFQNQDNAGYLLIHGGEIYKLAEDYKSIASQVNKAITTGFESPTLFRKNNLYYFIGSNLTSWERNDNYYYTAEALGGPWTSRGLFAPVNQLTWNSQTTYVIPIEGSIDTTYIFMGDRWSYPKQASAATYVWQPIAISGTQISISTFHPAWQLNPKTGRMADVKITEQIINPADKRIRYLGSWQHTTAPEHRNENKSDDTNASFSVTFTGRRIGFYSYTAIANGYARVVVTDQQGKISYDAIVDLYSKAGASGLVFLSPWLAHGKYTLTVSNTGERPNWSDKRKSQYGSTGNFISLEKIVLYP
jgi:hypothetical protein